VGPRDFAARHSFASTWPHSQSTVAEFVRIPLAPDRNSDEFCYRSTPGSSGSMRRSGRTAPEGSTPVNARSRCRRGCKKCRRGMSRTAALLETLRGIHATAVSPPFAVRARQGGRTDSNRAAPAVASASQEATKLPFQPSAHARHGPGPLHTMTSP
jgi:hypothetical protein